MKWRKSSSCSARCLLRVSVTSRRVGLSFEVGSERYRESEVSGEPGRGISINFGSSI